MKQMSLTIDSRPENVPLVGMCAKEFAGNLFNSEQLCNIEQALVETVNNCIEHAYSGFSEGKIKINYNLFNERFVIELIDQGKEFDATRLESLNTDFSYDPLDIDNLPEGGFGLIVISRSIDEISYRREDGNNFWTLTKFVS